MLFLYWSLAFARLFVLYVRYTTFIFIDILGFVNKNQTALEKNPTFSRIFLSLSTDFRLTLRKLHCIIELIIDNAEDL